MKSALKARPRVTVRRGPIPRFKLDNQVHFNLGPVMEVLDLIEFGGLVVDQALGRVCAPADGPPLEQGLATWVRSAVGQYLAALDPGLRPVPHDWVLIRRLERPDDRGARRYELCVWGRRYATPDGRVRELRVPIAKPTDEDERSRAELVVMAMVLAEGRPAELPDFRAWRQDAEEIEAPDGAAAPDLVRITVVSCIDGTARPLLSEPPRTVREQYLDVGKQQLAQAVAGNDFRPGRGCADCKLISSCPALPRTPGLLGIDDPDRPRRTWSVTNGRYYAGVVGGEVGCATRDRLYRLRLPTVADLEWKAAVVRGHAVHARIQEQHEAHPGVACRPDEAPDGTAPWTAGKWTIPAEEADRGARMVASHSRFCPYRLSTVTELIHEPQLTLHDTAADVIVTAKPDSLYRENGVRVYRETKTSGKHGLPAESDLLVERPQLALALLWMALTPDPGGPGRIELEMLGTDGARLEILTADQPHHVERARRIVYELVKDWHGDTRHVPNPGPHCARCSMTRWCSEGTALFGHPSETD